MDHIGDGRMNTVLVDRAMLPVPWHSYIEAWHYDLLLGVVGVCLVIIIWQIIDECV